VEKYFPEKVKGFSLLNMGWFCCRSLSMDIIGQSQSAEIWHDIRSKRREGLDGELRQEIGTPGQSWHSGS